MMATLYVQDHVVHFYHLHALDWVDIVNALKADPKKAAELAQSFSKWDKNTPAYFTDVQNKIKQFAASGLGIFANGYWGHPAYKLPPEVNLIAVAHYLDALEWQKEVVKIHAVFGGKNPHPNYLVGGVPCSINMNEVAAINSERLNLVSRLISQADEFVNEVYLPDLLAVASFYKDWASWGGGLTNYMSYGEYPTKGYNQPEVLQVPARRGALSRPQPGAPGQREGHPGNQGIHRQFLVRLQRRRQCGHPSLGRRNRTSTTPGRSLPSRHWKATKNIRS